MSLLLLVLSCLSLSITAAEQKQEGKQSSNLRELGYSFEVTLPFNPQVNYFRLPPPTWGGYLKPGLSSIKIALLCTRSVKETGKMYVTQDAYELNIARALALRNAQISATAKWREYFGDDSVDTVCLDNISELFQPIEYDTEICGNDHKNFTQHTSALDMLTIDSLMTLKSTIPDFVPDKKYPVVLRPLLERAGQCFIVSANNEALKFTQTQPLGTYQQRRAIAHQLELIQAQAQPQVKKAVWAMTPEKRKVYRKNLRRALLKTHKVKKVK